MKKLFSTLLMLVISYCSDAQNVGIGTLNPLARLHVTDSNVLFTATTVGARPPGFSLPVNGGGTRMMWVPQLAAFRAGAVPGPTWNADSIGFLSFAAGFGTMAKGNASTAFGEYTNASGNLSTALGGLTQATGNSSFATGFSAIASGTTSTAMGDGTAATGNTSTAMGKGTIASGSYTMAWGFNSKATGAGATALGISTKASGIGSVATGNNTVAASSYSFAIGQYNDTIAGSSSIDWVPADPLLYIGNGDNPDFPHNAAVIYKNGDADINGYVRLGDAANGSPRIKVKKLTAVMPAAQGGFTFVAHGIAQSKILNISSLVTVAGRYQIIPNHMQTGFQYTLNVDGADIAVGAVSGNSASLLGMPVKILITYEE